MISGFRLQRISTPVFEVQQRIDLKNKLEYPLNRFLKRLLDIILSFLFLVLIAPWLFPIVSIIIMIDSKGPPFFIQKRTGLGRRTFHCVKFRTMVQNTDANRLQVQIDDTRITKVGKFLRENHIDELPQILNVIWGDMSVVGPRPHMLRHNVEYAQLSPNYHLRHATKPGLTGLAQVRGYHGMIADEDDYKNRLSSDIEYIHNWSLIGDIEIFIMTTVKIIFRLDR
jgi:lipopolysaccharide/colanic/teichoic acid biosynthesis glycosyltransferase